jgi:hypothetical protein
MGLRWQIIAILIDSFEWEQPISNRIERLETDQEPDFD